MDKLFLEFVVEYFDNEEVVGCEIGVYQGGHALKMLQQLNLKRLYLIDSYRMPRIYPFTDKDKEIANARLKSYSMKVKWIYQKSQEAIKQIENQLDFVYIDASHRYLAVKRDVLSYYPLIKVNGILGGHDYYEGNERPTLMGVKPAVNEFVTQNKLKLVIGGRREGDRDWWVQKL